MKISGLEYKRWYEQHFPAGFRIDHAMKETRRNGEWLIADDELLDSNALGVLIWDGEPEQDPTGGRGMKVTTAIRNARRLDTDTLLLVQVPKSRHREALELLKTLDARVLTG